MRRALIAVLVLCFGLALAPAAQASSGVFDRLWGTDVVSGGGTGFETCTVAANCKGGVGTTAAGGAFAGPADVALGPDGNVYVADSGNNRVQVFSPAGAFLRAFGWGVNPAQPNALGTCTAAASCLAGAPEQQNGPRFEGGRLDEPRGIAVGPNGHVYVTEFRAHRLSEFTANGDFVRLWGVRVNDALAGDDFEICPAAQADQCTYGLAGGSTGDHGGGLQTPMGIDVDSQGDLYVADTGNRRIQKFTSAGQWLFTWGGFVYNSATPPDGNRNRCADGPMCKAGNPSDVGTGFQRPAGLAIGPGDKVYVHDGYRVSRFSSAGTFERTWGGGVTGTPGSGVCTVAASCFAGQLGAAGGEFYLGIGGITVDSAGDVYVSDGQRIQRFDSAGTFEAMWGRSVDPATPNAFGLCLTASACDYGTDGTLGGELSGNAGVETDSTGRLYVADGGNQRIVRYAASAAAPGAPTITAVSTTAPASSTQPLVTGAAGAGSTVRLYDNPACTGTPLATGTAAAFANPGLSITVALDATVTLYATASNSEGTSACSASSVSYTEASGPVNTQVHFSAATASTPESTPGLVLTVQRTGDLTRTTTVKWAPAAGTAKPFAAVGGGDFTGDGGTLTFAPGEATKTLSIAIIGDGLVEGPETFSVALSQPSARVEIDAPSTVAVTIVDDDFIDTEITSGPEGVTSNATPSFTFVATPAAGATFQCWLDKAAPKPCNDGTYQPGKVADGEHVLSVQATSPQGEADRSPATRSFFVDTVAPQPYVGFSGPLSGNGSTAFGGQTGISAYANDYFPGSGSVDVRCVIDPPTLPAALSDFPIPCTDPFVYGVFGTHTVYAGAVDKAGNFGISAPGLVTIVPVPRVNIESGPDGTVYSTLNTFEFSASVAGSTFRCSLDGSPPAPCTSPWRLPVLKTGSHYVQIYARSPQGFDDPTPPQRSFTIGPASTTVECKIAPLKVATGKQHCVFQQAGQSADQDCAGANVCKPIPACPVGAVCTLKLGVAWKNGDDASWEVVTAASGGTDGVAPARSASGTCGPSGQSGRACTANSEWSYLGGAVFTPWCGPLSTPRGASSAKDASRSLTCTATLTIVPAPPLASTTTSKRVATFVPSPGTVTATQGAAGGKGGRLGVAARAPKSKTKKPAGKPLFTATTVRAKAAGNVTIAFKLSKAATAQLKKKGKLALPITLTFKPDDGGPSIVVTKTSTVYPDVKSRVIPKVKRRP